MTANDRYRTILDGARDFAILSLSPDGIIQTWNTGAENIFGFTEEEVISQPGALIYTPEDRALGEDEREIKIAATEGRAEDDRWHVRKDGSRFWASGVITSMRSETGTIIGFVKVIRDKTNERRLQENLRISEEQFARLFMANPAAVVVERRDTEAFVMANEAFFTLVGYWRADIMGRSGKALRLWADPEQRRGALQHVESGEVCLSTPLDLRKKNGEVVHCLCAISTALINGQDHLVLTFIPLPA